MVSVKTHMSFAVPPQEGDNPEDTPILEKKEVQLSAFTHWNSFWGPGKVVQKFVVAKPAWLYPNTDRRINYQRRIVAEAMAEHLGLGGLPPTCVNFEIHHPQSGVAMGLDFDPAIERRMFRMCFREFWEEPKNTPTANPTPIVAEQFLIKYFRSSFDEMRHNHCGWTMYETIHPLAGTVKTYPLAICDPNTVDWQQDIRMRQILNEDGTIRGENTYLCHNDAQRWYYLKDQRPDEVILREIASSEVFRDPNYQIPSAPFAFPKVGDGNSEDPDIILMRWVVWGPLRNIN